MAVTVFDILHPEGELNKSMFPDDDVEVLAQTWFSDAAARTAALVAGDVKDAAVKAWTYHRAFTTVASSIASRPTSSSYYGSERQETWGADRIRYFQERAAFYLAQFNALAEPVVTNISIGYSVSAVRVAVW